jgi:digalactosyldiacylglycerol synthase
VHYRREKRSFVTLVIPWLELPVDQSELYNQVFESQAVQEGYIRAWLRKEAKLPDVADDLEILFYPARYHSGLRSIFAMGDIMAAIPTANRDVCILEEPEHCNWYRAPAKSWIQQFNYVVGIVHTSKYIFFGFIVTQEKKCDFC